MSKLIECKSCSKEIALSAKSCPNCGAKNKKPLYKRPLFIVVAVLIVFGSIGGGGDSSSSSNNTISETTQSTEQNTSVKEDIDNNIPTEYKSALRQAETYSGMMNMSKAGIYDQLTSEYGGQFTTEAAQYAIDNVEADWKENALKSAQTYQDSMAMSKAAIYDQLTSEYGGQFTAEEAQYAIDNLE